MEDVFIEESMGFVDWVNNYGNMIFFFGQLIFWLGMLVFIGYAVFQYKRWVNYQMGIGKSGALREAEEAGEAAPSEKPATEKVSVDKFVE